MGKKVVYGFADSPFGEIIVARTWDGICDLQFLGFNKMEVIHELGQRWGVYTPTSMSNEMAETVERVVFEGYDHPLNLDLRGTEFQIKVWKGIMQVPFGETISYQQLAYNIDEPTAIRAVATAVGQNPLAMLIPCHRIIHKDGSIGEYRWGKELKQQLLDWEKERVKK